MAARPRPEAITPWPRSSSKPNTAIPRYLETARKAMADLRSIWGLDAPQQLDVSRADPYASLTEAELLDRIAQQDTLLQRPSATTPAPPKRTCP